jgi:hypothetical protein
VNISLPAGIKGVVPIEAMVGENDEDTAYLSNMASAAEKYLRAFNWCRQILDGYFGDGIGGIVAVFLFHILPTRADVDGWLWVIVGDIPPAYLVIDRCKAPSEALEGYIEQMSKWVELANTGRSSNKVIPVPVPATPENATDLGKRLTFLKEMAVPRFRDGETERA